MYISTIMVTPFMQNARVLIDPRTREAMVIDPGGDIEKIAERLQYLGEPVFPRQILLTHSHIDHAGGVVRMGKLIEKSFGIKPTLLAHPLEKEFRANLSRTAPMFGLSPNDYQDVPEPDTYLEDGDEVKVGENSGRVRFTPGHSPGHIAIYFEPAESVLAPWEAQFEELKLNCPILIGGDLLFQGTIGRTDLPGGDGDTLLRSVREKIFPLPDDTRVLAGHGGDTSVGVEKRTNPFFN